MTVRRFVETGWPFNWHVHPEHELTLIVRGTGRRFVGDSIQDFGPGDLVLLASNVPHTWQADSQRRPWCESVVVQFRDDALGAGFFDLPEMVEVRRVLEAAQRGLRFPEAPKVADRLRTLPEQPAAMRLMALLESLLSLATLDAEALATATTPTKLRPHDRARIDAVCAFVQQNFADPITLDDAASAAHLSRTAFCRFFQRVMGRTFVDYLHELRISIACRLLADTDLSITEISQRVGFGNLANFNRVFKRRRGITPSAVRKQQR